MSLQNRRALAALLGTLQERVASGHNINFWLRDDDAVDPSPALDHLLQLTGQYSIPLLLAVIPASTGAALASRLRGLEHVSVAVHGWSHTNHAKHHEKKQELGNHRPLSEILGQLEHGRQQLSRLYDRQFVPLLVPPWNRIAPELVGQLADRGFIALSTFGDEQAGPLISVNSQIDIIDWKGTRGGRSVIDLVTGIQDCLDAGRTSIGILSHHLVHDEAAWSFLEQLFVATADCPGVHWQPFTQMLALSDQDPSGKA